MPARRKTSVQFSPIQYAGSDADQVAREFEEELEQSSKSVVSGLGPDSGDNTSNGSSLGELDLGEISETNEVSAIGKKGKKRGRPKSMLLCFFNSGFCSY